MVHSGDHLRFSVWESFLFGDHLRRVNVTVPVFMTPGRGELGEIFTEGI